MKKQDKNKRMREESGNIITEDKIIVLLYTLMRDEILPGKLEEIVSSIEDKQLKRIPWFFTNGWLAQYAKSLRRRLL